MGILSRFRSIMASNVNAILDKAEDPEKTMDDFVRCLNSDLGKVQAETASVLADERRAKRALDECNAEIKKLQNYAEKAAEAGNDEDAIKFLERKATQADNRNELQAAYEAAALNAASMKQIQDKLVLDRNQLEARHANLKGKMAATQTQQRLNAIGSPLGTKDSIFEAMEDKVNNAYNEAMAIAELRAGAKDERDDLDELFLQKEKSDSKNPKDELAAIKEKIKNRE
ncbi:MAG: PspA/IM30 family protein [Gorillibacterium sp.]|nr:PspA/IM30 family protein [Gorillibacterium sp.]